MTNLQFIEKEFYAHHDSEKWHGSLFRDGDGNIYSYGRHYPLMFTSTDDGGLVFINTTGYSNTTAKHIRDAWTACDNDAIPLKMNNQRLGREFKLGDALYLLTQEQARIIKAMNAKKRKDTNVYRALQLELDRVMHNIKIIKERMS
jgi:hypothetical protein